MLWNSLLLAVRAIRRNVLRSFLTILGVVIGVASVIVMVTLGDGATQSVKEQMQSLGANLLMVRPGMRMGPGRDEALSPNFKMADVEALAEQTTAAQAVVPTASATVTVVYGNKNWQTNATGSTAAYFQTNNWRLASGRFFTEAEAALSHLNIAPHWASSWTMAASPVVSSRSVPSGKVFFLRDFEKYQSLTSRRRFLEAETLATWVRLKAMSASRWCSVDPL